MQLQLKTHHYNGSQLPTIVYNHQNSNLRVIILGTSSSGLPNNVLTMRHIYAI